LLGEHSLPAILTEHGNAVDLEQEQRPVLLQGKASDLVRVAMKALVLEALMLDAE